MTNIRTLGIGEFDASKIPTDTLKTYALGSCVGVVLLHLPTHTAGLIHIALPDSSINPNNLRHDRPGYFADLGIPALLRRMEMKYNCKIGPYGERMIAKIAGGSNVMDANKTFSIGDRNVEAVLKILNRYRIRTVACDTGSSLSRTLSVSVKTGKVVVSCPGKGSWEI